MSYLVLDESVTLHSAIQALDDTGKGVLAVVDIQNKLVGIITDGDVRRAILRDEFTLDKIINLNPVKKRAGKDPKEIRAFLKQIKRRHIPIVDENNNFIEIISLDDYDFYQTTNPIVIMAGGLGSRLGKLTENIPKPMLKVGDKPIIQNIIETFSEAGFSKFYICVNYKSEVIKEYLKNGAALGVDITYIEEDKRLGTAGALAYLKGRISDSFFVVNGDILTTVGFNDLLAFHQSNNSDATVCVRNIEVNIPFGVVEVDKNILCKITEKPVKVFNINAGIYIFEPKVLDKLKEDNYLDMNVLISDIVDSNGYVSAYHLQDSWIDIGQIEDYIKTDKAFWMRKKQGIL